MYMAVLPNTVIHMKVKPAGMNSTASTNSRTVLPREIRAMKDGEPSVSDSGGDYTVTGVEATFEGDEHK